MTDSLSLISWSDKEYSMEEFIQNFQNSLPVLVQVTSGMSGCDDGIHEVGSGEIYWIHGIHRQKRAVAGTVTGKYLSIPSDYYLKFTLFSSLGTTKPSLSMQDLIDLLLEVNSVDFMPDRDRTISYMVGAGSGNIERFGRMNLIDTYDQKYLLTYCVHAGIIHLATLPIPVYMDITVSVATGFKYGTKEEFKSWCQQVQMMTSDAPKTYIEECHEIIMFNELPANKNYEYIQCKANLQIKNDNEISKTYTDGTSKNDYQFQVSNSPVVPPKSYTRSKSCEQGTSTVGRSRYLSQSGKKSLRKVVLPLMPEKKNQEVASSPFYEKPSREKDENSLSSSEEYEEIAPSPYLEMIPSSYCISSSSNATKVKDAAAADNKFSKEKKLISELNALNSEKAALGKKTKTVLKECSSVDTSRATSNNMRFSSTKGEPKTLPKPKYTTDAIEKNRAGLLCKKSSIDTILSNEATASAPMDDSTSRESPASDPEPLDDSRADPPCSPDPSNHFQAPPTRSRDSLDVWRFENISDIPSNLDVSLMTVDDITHCLKLLKMDEHSQAMLEEDVDGSLLLQLNDNILVEKFSFSQFEAKKLMNFVHGWRPKRSNKLSTT